MPQGVFTETLFKALFIPTRALTNHKPLRDAILTGPFTVRCSGKP